jgi:hypothetical protein
MMGWMYMVVCSFDFVIAPILWSVMNSFTHGSTAQWAPLTLQGAGLFHISMGAVLGLAAYGRTQEKLAGANNGGLSLPSTTSTPAGLSGGFTSPATGGFGTPTASATTPVSAGFGGFSSPTPVNTSAPTGFGATLDTPVASISVNASGKKIIPTTLDPVI